jgi:hypothetical protein
MTASSSSTEKAEKIKSKLARSTLMSLQPLNPRSIVRIVRKQIRNRNRGREPWGETSITRVTKRTKYKHALVLEESDVAGLDGLLGRAKAGLVDLLLVPGPAS